VVFQNNFSSSWLFKKNLPSLIGKCEYIKVADLLKSNVFLFKFDFELWPQNHTDEEDMIRPYNGSIFHLRDAYRNIFPEKRFKPISDDADSTKVFKVNYYINLLPTIGVHNEYSTEQKKDILVVPEYNIMQLFTDSEELDIYQSESL